jgi:teichuronic acid biosynthesis glycosyltransferase TuaG
VVCISTDFGISEGFPITREKNINIDSYSFIMISILIPIKNGIEFIDDSVSSVIQQTYENWELIIGINGHPPSSHVYTIATKYASDKIQVIDLCDVSGKAHALNTMLTYAKYPYIALLDVDDIWLPTKLEKQVPFLLAGYSVVGSQCVYFGPMDNSGVIPPIPLEDVSKYDFFQSNPIINSSAIVTKELCQWDTSTILEDYDLWLMLWLKKARFYNLPEVLVRHRTHLASAFNSGGANHRAVPDLLAKYSGKNINTIFEKTDMPVRIKIFSSFCDSNNCKSVYERLCETDLMANYGEGKEIFIVSENDENYTHAILVNTAMPVLTIPKENVVGLAFEPPQFIINDGFTTFVEYAKRHVGKYFIGDATGLPEPFESRYAYMWHITPPRKLPEKNKMMSIMVSDKQFAPGHKYRHELVRAILATNYNIDIYGRGCKYYANDPRLKGEFTDDEPYENYHFHICIENFQTPNYTSEKYTNAILWGATPLYWGAANKLFPDITISLSGDISKDMALIANIMYYPITYKKFFSQEEIRPKLNILKDLF